MPKPTQTPSNPSQIRPPTSDSGPDSADLARLYRSVLRIRRVEEAVARVYPSDRIKSPIHLSIGQEAVAVGVIDVLALEDIVANSYRCHATYLAKGGCLRGMIAEMFGKAAGSAGGKGGSMHLAAPEAGVMGASAVVATQIPLAVGAALTQKMRGTPHLVAVFFGDGACEEGVFHESLNFAALHRLPVLFVCENNGYAIHTRLDKRWATDRLTERVATYGLPVHQIPDGNLFDIRRRTVELIGPMRRGTGPAFLEVGTYRWREHVGPHEDFDAGYRSRDEAAPWMAADPVRQLACMVPPAIRTAIDAAIDAEIADAFAYAEAAPLPEPEDLYTHVFAD